MPSGPAVRTVRPFTSRPFSSRESFRARTSSRKHAMSDLTPRQTEVLRLIQRAIAETGMPPTRAEIAQELGFKSANAAEEHLRALARKGVIALVPGASRGIQLKDTMREQFGLPLIGRASCRERV